MASPKTTASIDSSPRSEKKRVSRVISPGYSQSVISRMIAIRSARIASGVVLMASAPVAQGGGDHPVALPGGVRDQPLAGELRDPPGEAGSEDHRHAPGRRVEGPDRQGARPVRQSLPQRLRDRFLGTPETGDPLVAP